MKWGLFRLSPTSLGWIPRSQSPCTVDGAHRTRPRRSRTGLSSLYSIGLIALLSSCAYYEDRAADRITEVGKLMAAVDERIIHGDDAFTGNERDAFERGLQAWAQFTRGRVRLRIIWDLDDTNYLTLRPALFRVLPNDMHDGRAGAVEGDSIWWAPDSCPDKQACAMHETGHFLGLCIFPQPHVPYTNNVMSNPNPARNFGYGDWRECLRVGVCRESRPDVTTVTVQIDPAIPRVEPEYPAR